MKIVGIFILGLVFAALVSLLPTALWYTFDDRLAYITGNPAWGDIPFVNVWGFTWFVSMVVSESKLTFHEDK